MACLIHDASNGSGQGGFGAVWGSKNLKAISVIGTGSIRVNNPHPFGDIVAEGFVRAAKKWGRLEGDQGDLKTRRLKFPNWGLPQHKEPRLQLD